MKNATEAVQVSFIETFIFEWSAYIALFIVSVIALTIIIERTYYYFRKAKPAGYYFLAKLKDALMEGNYEQALALAKQNDGPAARVIETGIEQKMKNSPYLEEEMQQSGNEQISLLEKYMAGLATIATISPLLGILGTVLGMIKAFAYYSIGSNKFEMMSGINVALYTTAIGLSIAIPSYIFYNFLIRKMNEKILELEGASTQILLILTSKKK